MIQVGIADHCGWKVLGNTIQIPLSVREDFLLVGKCSRWLGWRRIYLVWVVCVKSTASRRKRGMAWSALQLRSSDIYLLLGSFSGFKITHHCVSSDIYCLHTWLLSIPQVVPSYPVHPVSFLTASRSIKTGRQAQFKFFFFLQSRGVTLLETGGLERDLIQQA
jgi:hypothetical protein